VTNLGNQADSLANAFTYRAPTAPTAPLALKGILYNRLTYLSWRAPADDGGSPITKYWVRQATNASGPWTDLTTTSPGTTWTTGTLNTSADYYFQVAAYNVQGWGPFAQIGPLRPCGAGLIFVGGSCQSVAGSDTKSVGHGNSVTSANLVTSAQTPASNIEILSEPTDGGSGTAVLSSTSQRKVTYTAPNGVGTAVIYCTSSGGGARGVFIVTIT
jgi:hypothetical protein